MPRRKAETTIPTFDHLNPDYTAKEGLVFPELKRSSTQSIHWTQLTPLWLIREHLNRTHPGALGRRIRNVTLVDGAYHFEVNLRPFGADPFWQKESIPQQEVEAEE